MRFHCPTGHCAFSRLIGSAENDWLRCFEAMMIVVSVLPHCAFHPCHNGGYCTNMPYSSYHCSCREGFAGHDCSQCTISGVYLLFDEIYVVSASKCLTYVDTFTFLCKECFLLLLANMAFANLLCVWRMFLICTSPRFEMQYICNICHFGSFKTLWWCCRNCVYFSQNNILQRMK